MITIRSGEDLVAHGDGQTVVDAGGTALQNVSVVFLLAERLKHVLSCQVDKEVETTARSSNRKRNKEKTPDSSRSSTTSSPVKKDARRNLAANDSSDDFVESTPPAAAASGSSRSRRCDGVDRFDPRH